MKPTPPPALSAGGRARTRRSHRRTDDAKGTRTTRSIEAWNDALYASTPSLEALRLIISHAATHAEDGVRRMVMVNDVARAYFYAKINRDVYIELPKEDPKADPNMLGRLRLCLYGTRDAALN